MRNTLKIGAAVLATALLAGPVGYAVADSKSSETYKQLNLFGDVFEQIRSEYVEPVEDAKLIATALNGMLSSRDPHSSYMN